MQLKLRDYQTKTIEYMTTPRVKLNEGDSDYTLCRCMITHAPGAGKTFCATEAAKLLTQARTKLVGIPGMRATTAVICPAHLIDQWFEFIHEQYPDDHVVSAEGQNKRQFLKANGWDWLIVSVQSLRRKDFYDLCVGAFIRNHVHVCIIDESHYIKNRDAKQSNHVRQLTRSDFVPHVFLLTATPITREADDLYHQLRVTDPHTFRSMDRFLNTYCWFNYGSYGPTNVSFRRGATQLLEGKSVPGQPSLQSSNEGLGWMLGYSYADIGLSLPPIIPPTGSRDALIKQSLPPQLRKAYDDIKAFWLHAITTTDGQQRVVLDGNNSMEIMHLLRALTNCQEKRAKLIQYLETDPGPYLIGCFYRKSAHDLAHDIKEAGYNPKVITGEIPAPHRVEIAKSHGHGSNASKDVIIATIPAISEGCDLSHLNTVLFYEEDYTPGKMYQFMSRVRRHRNSDGIVSIDPDPTNGTFHLSVSDNGPTNETPVICRYIHAANTIDERIHAVQSNRAVNIKDLIKVELQA